MACVYDNTLADDCTTPLNSSGGPLTGGTGGFIDAGSGLPVVNPSSLSTPVAPTASDSGGTSLTSFFSGLGNLVAPITAAVSGSSASTSLRLQTNPATGQLQYFNPATGQYVGSAVSPTGSPLGTSSFLLVIFALVIAFFAFGGKKAIATA